MGKCKLTSLQFSKRVQGTPFHLQSHLPAQKDCLHILFQVLDSVILKKFLEIKEICVL